MDNIMLDLETMGNQPNSPIIAIGAVPFEITDHGIIMGTGIHVVVDLETSLAAGAEADGSTIKWWMKQSDDARKVFDTPDAVSIEAALQQFGAFARNQGCGRNKLKVWGNGAAFDNVILNNAYKLSGIETPWQFWNDRCYRTLKGLYPEVPMTRVGTHHNALDDAKTQTLHLRDILIAAGVCKPR